ncbi:MAG: sigma-70 family RNA polymerase sigma factor [Planctomycetes bacterium]|nr:sigma-70 family RNA polymerase sigma factor [Planctomycetota bacterium]
MSQGANTTCWMVIEQASAGSRADREEFASRYLGIVRAYLSNRWRGTDLLGDLDDAVQEVFLECFKRGGVLDRLRSRRPASFRAFLYGVSRNVARRWEKSAGRERGRHPPLEIDPERISADEATQSRVFDRAWAQTLFHQAGDLQRERARAAGEAALRRVELLELRFGDAMPIRAIAARWGLDAAAVHKEYARAREEFKSALEEVISFHHPGLSAAEIEAKCVELVGLLQG